MSTNSGYTLEQAETNAKNRAWTTPKQIYYFRLWLVTSENRRNIDKDKNSSGSYRKERTDGITSTSDKRRTTGVSAVSGTNKSGKSNKLVGQYSGDKYKSKL